MVWTATDIGDLTGRTAVVTGSNGGLGLETTKALAAAGAHVVMAARDQTKARAAMATIMASDAAASLEIVELDLASLDSVRAAADTILSHHRSIDLLINNAGLMALPQRRTIDGFETQFGVNHLGHFALTAHLLPAVLRADAARVVTVTSTARHLARSVDAANPHLEGKYTPWRAYGQSKKANYHFAIGLDQRFRAAGATARSLAAHPGLSDTDLQSNTAREGAAGRAGAFFHWITAGMGMSAEQGARPQLRAATDPSARGGRLYGPRFASNGAAVRLPVIRHPWLDAQITTLWEVSERETAITIDVPASADTATP